MSDTISIVKNDRRQCVTIEGITYSYELFKQFGGTMPLNTLMVITSRENGVISIAEAEPGDLFKVKGGMPYKIPYVTGPEPTPDYITSSDPGPTKFINRKLSWFDRLLLWLGRR